MTPLAVLTGIVIHGKGLGHTVGMPTANTSFSQSLPIAEGVYASCVRIDGEKHIGVTNIGHRPTVDSDDRITVETNIIDFDEDIYGLDIGLSFIRMIRKEIRFGSMAALKEQLDKDRELCINLIDTVYGD